MPDVYRRSAGVREAATAASPSGMSAREWTEYIVRCRRWGRDLGGKKIWETVDLSAVDKKQAQQFYDGIKRGGGALEDPEIFIRTITERQLI